MAASTIMAELNLRVAPFFNTTNSGIHIQLRGRLQGIWIASGVLFLHLLGANSMDNTLGLT